MEKKRVFSGIQPTGNVHIGNFIGAFRNWVPMQDTYDAVYCVVDLHAITVPQDPQTFLTDRHNMAKILLSVGIDPDRSLLYFQSQVPQHSELAWILGTMTPTGVLGRMTQFKEKADKAGSNLGLYSYPVLMAADILLFHAHAVPVGEDQKQHLEMTRDLAARFNNRYGEEFPIPEPIVPETGARVMSLLDPTAKMSKSDENPATRIGIVDSPDEIRAKLGRAVTDSGNEVRLDWEDKPGISNLLEILSAFTETPIADLEEEYGAVGYGKFKEVVAEAVIEGLAPVRQKYRSLDDAEVDRIMQKGALDARTRAEGYQQRIRRRIGLAE